MRILVTGASGLLGANIALEAAGQGHEVFGAVNSVPLRTKHFNVLKADLLEKNALQHLFEQSRPDWVIHCAAMANLEACERQPEFAHRINSEVPGFLAEICRKGGARLLHVSTDAVFDGIKGQYTENDLPKPLSVYARTKLAGEQAVASGNPDALIARVNLFGFSPSGNRSLAEFFLNNLLENQPLKGFTDVYFCPVLVNQIAGLFFKMFAKQLTGLYHVFSADCLSKYDFGLQIANRFSLNADLISPVSVSQGGLAAARAPNLTMVTDKLSTDLGESLPIISTMLEHFYTLYQQGYPQKLKNLIDNRI